MKEKATFVRRNGVPVLDFCFLIYRDGDSWIARSVLTSHVGEGLSAESALRGLMGAIDACVFAAEEHGVSTEEWYRTQLKDETEFVTAFLRLVAHESPSRIEWESPSGKVIINASIGQAA